MISLNLMDPGINSAAQNLSPALTILIAEGRVLDTTAVYLLVIAALYLGFHPRHGIRLAVLFGITAGINEALKLVFHLPRPYWVSNTVKAYAAHSSFGFPSGAAMGSIVMYGYFTRVVRRWWTFVICGILFAWTGLARIFAGVHFLLDIIGGLLFGFLILILSLQAIPKIDTWAGSLSLRSRIAGIVLVSFFPLIASCGAQSFDANPALRAISGTQQVSQNNTIAMERTRAP